MKTILLAGVLMLGLLRSASAFSLAGPVGNGGDSWQVQNIGYGPPTDFVAPKNIGEEYRRNTPVLYYAYNANFLDYFGSNGVVAVNGAFAIMNNLTNVSKYSSSLSEFPLQAAHANYQAQALGLRDLKSSTLGILVRQMGLANPIEYVWTIHDRYLLPGTSCPAGEEYLVVQRNFDTGGSPVSGSSSVSSLYSPYINGVLWSYAIEEVCQNSPVLAQAIPELVDPLSQANYPVAVADGSDIIDYGDYYTGLTRDDMMGLRYLLQTNNINTETAAPGSVLINAITNGITAFPANTNSINGYGTFDLGALISASITNNAAALEALFPGVIVSSSSSYLGYTTNYSITAYYTNFIASAAGAPPQLVLVTNTQPSFGIFYSNTFANIITNHFYSNTVETLQTYTVEPLEGAAAPAPLVTNISSKTITLKGVPSGDYYILPTDPCGLDIINPHYFTNVVVVTNIPTSIFGTNVTIATNSSGFSYSQLVTKTTNYVLEIYSTTCAETPTPTSSYQGVEKVSFVQADFDSYIGQYFQPITNNYTMTMITNSQPQVQRFQRIVTEPDFLFSADDQTAGGGAIPLVGNYSESLNFDTDNVLAKQAGPGTINPQTIISFDKVGPVYFNTAQNLTGNDYWQASPGNNTNVDEYFSGYFVWGSFDGTTNAPIVYPDGSTIDDLGNLILIQITPTVLPNGTNNVAYTSTTFTASGGAFTQPYTWSAAGLPNGLSVASNSDNTATLAGTPTQSGTFVFTLTLTDSLSRTVQWNYPIIIQ